MKTVSFLILTLVSCATFANEPIFEVGKTYIVSANGGSSTVTVKEINGSWISIVGTQICGDIKGKCWLNSAQFGAVGEL